MRNTRAVATLAIGDTYRAISRITSPSMKRYAKEISADFVLLETCRGSIPHFEKFRLHELLASYQRVLYLDADLIVRKDCPNLFDQVPGDHLGLYDEHRLATEPERRIHQDVMLKACHAYERPGYRITNYYNTGVIVASKDHAAIFERPAKEILLPYWEQPVINMLIHKSSTRVFDIGYRFNRMPYLDGRVEYRLESYVIHYAGLQGDMSKMINSDLTAWENS